MKNEIKNPIFELLKRKVKAQKQAQNSFNPNNGKNMKTQVGNTRPNVMRKQGRGS